MTDKQVLADLLKTAIKGEVDGYRFYDLLAGKATDADARRKLEGLRDDEKRHKATLEDLYQKYVGGEIGELPEKGLTPLAEVFRKGELDRRKTETEFINLAIEAELAATHYYQDKMEASDNAQFREIFDRLAAEEHSHYELLQAEKQALGGNYHWFSLDEGAPLED